MVEKVRSSSLIEMKELLPNNVALLQYLKEIDATNQPLSSNTTHLHDICDSLSRATCFMSLVAAQTDHQETTELMAYGKTMISLAQGHGSLGWATYDSLFC